MTLTCSKIDSTKSYFIRLKQAETQAENSEMNIQRLNIRQRELKFKNIIDGFMIQGNETSYQGTRLIVNIYHCGNMTPSQIKNANH